MKDKRNRTKIIWISALCLLAFLAVGCGKASEGEGEDVSSEAQSGEAPQEPSFEEQYDLGMRLLSEGKYEEAIIAFTAALEINPKSVDVYAALADTYEAMGDTEALRRILEQGIEATGDAELEERLSALPPQLPEGFSYKESSYVPTDEELELLFAEAIEAGLAGNRDILEDDAWNAELARKVGAYLKARSESSGKRIGYVSEKEDNVRYVFWTLLSEGSLLHFTYVEHVGLGLNYKLEYRPESGNGFYSTVQDYRQGAESSYYIYDLVSCGADGWYFNGDFTHDSYYITYTNVSESQGAFRGEITQSTGTLVNDLIDGEMVTTVRHFDEFDESGETDESVLHRNFKAGELQGNDSGDSKIYYYWTD